MLGDVECAYTRKNHDERDENLEETREDETLLRFLDVLCCETLLDDVLVESPVSEVGEPERTYDGHETRYVRERLRGV